MDVYRAMEALLIDTGEFGLDCVQIGHPKDWEKLFPADRFAVALITPDNWDRNDDDRVDEERRAVGYTLTLGVRHDPRGRYEVLDRLSCLAQNILDGQSIADLTYRSMTKLTGGTFETPADDEQRLRMRGTFTYRVIGHDAHDATERDGV